MGFRLLKGLGFVSVELSQEVFKIDLLMVVDRNEIVGVRWSLSRVTNRLLVELWHGQVKVGPLALVLKN